MVKQEIIPTKYVLYLSGVNEIVWLIITILQVISAYFILLRVRQWFSVQKEISEKVYT